MNPTLPSESGEQQQSYRNSDRDRETGGREVEYRQESKEQVRAKAKRIG